MSDRLQNTDYLLLKLAKRFVLKLILILAMMSLEAYAVKNSIYVRNAILDGVYMAEEQLDIIEAETKMICMMLCNQNERCQSVSYNSFSMKCQHFLKAFWNGPVIGTNASGWLHYDPSALDCKDLNDSHYPTGVYPISPGNVQRFSVKCKMDVDGGGWTVIQQRFDGTISFQRTWIEYKRGFGNVKGEFWLGNDQIHAITTSADHELRIDISDWHGNSWYAVYKTFIVGDENSQYKLTIGTYSGNAGDSMSYHNGMNFSTVDRDNDVYPLHHCSVVYGGSGGWWYNACDKADLNGGVYGEDIGESIGTEWESALGKGALTLKTTRMMIRQL